MNFIFKPKPTKGWMLGFEGQDRTFHFLEEGDTKADLLIALAIRVVKFEKLNYFEKENS